MTAEPPDPHSPTLPAWKNTGWLKLGALAAGLLFLGVAYVYAPAPSETSETPLPRPALDLPRSATAGGLQSVVLAGGCFWGVQGVFEHVKGVHEAIAGYSGGAENTADYKSVSTGRTGHAEAVKVFFDPAQISLGDILRIFFSVAHDPTERDRQGPDFGPQYRSDVFYADDAQRRVAAAYIAQLGTAKRFPHAIVTRMDALNGFYPAEEIHQDYVVRNPESIYVMMNDLPKIASLKRLFPDLYRDAPATVIPMATADAKRPA